MKIIKLLIVTCLLFTVQTAVANELDFNMGAYGSVWDGKEDPGWGAGAKAGLGLHEGLRLELRGTYIDGMTANKAPGKFELDAVPLDLGLAYHFLPDKKVRPYVLGGASYVFMDGDGTSVDDEAGWFAGAGAEVGATDGLAFFAETYYRQVNDPDTGNGTEIEVHGVTLNAGVNYRF